LLLGLELKAEPKRIVNTLRARHGILTGLEGPLGNVLKLRPPLSFRRLHADQLIAAIDATLGALPGV
jgi:4-aminobutyrate aminotransferase-like enzyme